MYKNDDIINFGSGSERDINWSIKNIRSYGTGRYFDCGVCEIKNVICDLEADGQDSITVATNSIVSMTETNSQHSPQEISFWRKDIHNPLSQSIHNAETDDDGSGER